MSHPPAAQIAAVCSPTATCSTKHYAVVQKYPRYLEISIPKSGDRLESIPLPSLPWFIVFWSVFDDKKETMLWEDDEEVVAMLYLYYIGITP
jgi:hypothetical protein